MINLNQVYTSLFLFSLAAIQTSTAASKYAKQGCNDTCGDVTIPYPFGIGASCSVNEWYVVDCISSTPYLHKLNQLQVLGVDLENQTVTVNMLAMSGCSQTNIVDLGRSPFFYSKSQNKFVFEGCGNAVMTDHESLVTGCSNTCGNESVSDTNTCLGTNCCQTTIPHQLKSYNINVTRLDGDGECGSAFLVDEDSYHEGRFSVREDDTSYVPVSLLWTLTDSDSERLSCCSYLWTRIEVDQGNGTSMESWKCIYSEYAELVGNLYLSDGCHYMSMEDEVCAKCQIGGGFCITTIHVSFDGTLTTNNPPVKCQFDALPFYHESRPSHLGVILVELLTREKPISESRFGENRSLATHFMSAMEEGRVLSILDAILVNEGNRDDLLAVANLAMRCLNLNGKYRPTMKEVAIELETIQASHVPSDIQTNHIPLSYGDDFSRITYSE
ncbi:hypothetical protein QVD17_37360 [Tagetes erecta]|uniref:Uncharacterized protein n=1 Tax=Tagetes erecta TaxID=13708 RepID=A0AAD8JWB6_TARER|nr:hypothetical protein QVD17_37360 [Tagetes erecta]